MVGPQRGLAHGEKEDGRRACRARLGEDRQTFLLAGPLVQEEQSAAPGEPATRGKGSWSNCSS
jgi:hypothetical protein